MTLKKQDFLHLLQLIILSQKIKILIQLVDETDQEKVQATITWPIIKGGENISTIKKVLF